MDVFFAPKNIGGGLYLAPISTNTPTIVSTTVGSAIAYGLTASISSQTVVKTAIGSCIADGKKAVIKFGNSNIKPGDRLVTSLLRQTITITLK